MSIIEKTNELIDMLSPKTNMIKANAAFDNSMGSEDKLVDLMERIKVLQQNDKLDRFGDVDYDRLFEEAGNDGSEAIPVDIITALGSIELLVVKLNQSEDTSSDTYFNDITAISNAVGELEGMINYKDMQEYIDTPTAI